MTDTETGRESRAERELGVGRRGDGTGVGRSSESWRQESGDGSWGLGQTERKFRGDGSRESGLGAEET